MTTFTQPKEELARILGKELDWFHHNCHAASLALVKTGLLPGARVARGFAERVGSQHSWVTLGDPYDRTAQIIDPTIWTYRDDIDDVWYGTLSDGIHTPHGSGSIMRAGRPVHGGGENLTVEGLSDDAEFFLGLTGPLDKLGWARLFHLPVEGWPSSEILTKLLDQHPDMDALIPIDIVGMLTDRNPGGLYRA